MIADPYTQPVANSYRGEVFISAGLVSATVVQQLAATKPWVRCLSVMAFIGAASMLLEAFSMFMQGITMDEAVMIRANQGQPVLGALGFNGLAGVYAVFTFLLILLSLKLWKYASNIGVLLHTRSEKDLVAALNRQRSFWKFSGIMVITMLVILLIVTIGLAVMFSNTVASHIRR